MNILEFNEDDELHRTLRDLIGPFEGIAYNDGDRYAHGIALWPTLHPNGVTLTVGTTEFVVNIRRNEWTVVCGNGKSKTVESDYWMF